ncbi:helix-hairpin-helix domain-containing protein [Kitasatospora sp. NBC_00458]|uniref:helix-hairpin-helix domain-containing protein n=1 Tax=Kitasatospora sp. NBC_00458 TaxID=2903568 RepID=UPI002E19DC97
MTSMRIGAARRRRIQHITETAGLRMAALLPHTEGPHTEGPPDEPSVYEGSADRPTVAGRSANGRPPAGGAGVGAGPPRGRPDPPPDRLSEPPPDSLSAELPGAVPGLPFAGPPDLPSGLSTDLPLGLPPDVPSGGPAVGPPDGRAGAEPVAGPGRAFPWAGALAALDRRAVVGLLVLLLLAVGYGVQHFWLDRPQSVEVPAVAVASAEPAASVPGLPGSGGLSEVGDAPGAGAPGGGATGAEPSAFVVVDIGGRVHSPGVHTLPGGSRVADALRVAGGPLPDTDTRNLNLARVLTDGEQILVGEPGLQPAAGSGAGAPPAGTAKQPVSLNRATLEQLDTLPGVGPTLAQRIIAFRTSHGGMFRSVDQLRQVSGIGERTYSEIRPLLIL